MTSSNVLLPLDGLTRDLRAGLMSSRDLLAEFVDRISGSGQINAVVQTDLDSAWRAADRADELLRDGRGGALCGVPVTVKKTLDVQDFADENGAPCATDAAVVARLRQADAVVFGRTNAPPAAADIETSHPRHGTTRNPHDVDRGAGGSSGGSAAAVAAGHTAVDLGSDVSGSIRIPAHCCGVYGFRPSGGVIPQHGHHPGPQPMQTIGPLTRHVGDLGLLWMVLTGEAVSKSPTGRVAVHIDPSHVDPDVLDVLHGFVDTLGAAGIRTTEVELPTQLRDTWLLFQQVLFSAEQDFAGRDFAGQGDSDLTYVDVDSEPIEIALWAAGIGTADRARISARQAETTARWHRFFGCYDMLLLPAMPTVAQPIRDVRIPVLADRVNGRPLFEQSIWCAPASLTGLPAAVLPAGVTRDGLPVGIQAIGVRDADLLGRLEGMFA
ncbi:MAG TPA: amidase family protein [Pseudonocardiaceae bacterium]|jgi:amidase|nr:amidase family protein [Pseudonocardiaceae bacterium]